ncbi:MAG: hypothetical protein C4576_13820 [Desulfobacteraceae bacterium]|nr:MAG: hypothetical protein C4576_13820 [Desulfobacteraceae bacterium]
MKHDISKEEIIKMVMGILKAQGLQVLGQVIFDQNLPRFRGWFADCGGHSRADVLYDPNRKTLSLSAGDVKVPSLDHQYVCELVNMFNHVASSGSWVFQGTSIEYMEEMVVLGEQAVSLLKPFVERFLLHYKTLYPIVKNALETRMDPDLVRN